MWIADNWKDYEVIDCSNGEKLERWGDYLLVRPDPQVIWNTKKNHKGWKQMNGHYHRSKKGGGEWEFFSLPQQWQIHYGSLTFNLKPFSFKHTGLFPEQATNWDWFSEKIRNAGRPGKSFESFCLYRRRNSCGSGRRSACHPCGRLKRHGRLGERKRSVFRAKDAPIRWLVDDCVNLSNGRSAAAILMTRSSWILRLMAAVRKAKYGRSKI